MKIKIVILLIISSSVMVLFSCKKDKTEVYHYSFYSVKWDNVMSDDNKDGYITSGILNCVINLKENATRRIYCNVYSKLSSTDEYVFYSKTDVKNFNGADSPLFLQIPVGAASTELAYGTYDFMVELFEEGSTSLSATTAGDTLFLATQKFERLADDQIYTVNALWKNDLDNNGDGYAQSSTLYFNVDIQNQLQKDVYAEIYYQESSASNWNLLETTGTFTITGTSAADMDSVIIGKKPDELANGQYNFKILVYESGGFFPVASADNNTSSVLKAKKFQTLADDSYYYSIDPNSVKWLSIRDKDADSYIDSAVLEFDVNVDKQATREIFAKIYVRNQDSLNFICFDSTDVFSVTGSSADDKHQIVIKSNRPYGHQNLYLDSAKYSFMISVYENVPFNKRVELCSYGGDTEGNPLYDQKFERP